MRKVSSPTDVVADRIVGKPNIQYEIDREAIARYGVSIRDVQDVIEIAIGGENLTVSVEGRERYPIRVRYPREYRERFDDLERILVPTSTGALVPISQLARITYSIGPQELTSEGGLLVGYVTLNTRDRDEVSVVEDAEKLRQSERLRNDELVVASKHEQATLVVPAGYYWKWSGQFENQRRATERLSVLVPIVMLSIRWSVLLLLCGGTLAGCRAAHRIPSEEYAAVPSSARSASDFVAHPETYANAAVREAEAMVVAGAREYDAMRDETLEAVKDHFAQAQSQQDCRLLQIVCSSTRLDAIAPADLNGLVRCARRGVYPPGGEATAMRECPACPRISPPNGPQPICGDCEIEIAELDFCMDAATDSTDRRIPCIIVLLVVAECRDGGRSCGKPRETWWT